MKMKNWQKVMIVMEVYPNITREKLEAALGLSRSGVAKIIRQLIDEDKIKRVGPDKGGHWEIIPSDEEPEYFFFYGHDPEKKGVGDKAVFSQWYIKPFMVDSHRYVCMEQYMMSEKALLFKDMEMLKQILNTKDPATCKKLGRKVKNFDSEIWNEHSQKIVFKGNYAKFSQNSRLKELLLSTGDKVLVEASPFDKIWGIGMRPCKAAEDHNNWRGKNQLGYTLTRVKKAIIADAILNGTIEDLVDK